MEFQVLRVHHYGETTETDMRFTLSPSNIMGIAAGVEDKIVNGRSVRAVTVLSLDGGTIDLNINHADLELLESAVGSFCLG